MQQPILNTVDEQDSKQLFSYNPNTGELVGSVAISGKEEVTTAVTRARAAQPAWAARTLKARIKVMRQIQEALVDHAAEISTLVSQEMGKCETDTFMGDALIALTSLTGYLKLAPTVLRTRQSRSGLLHFNKRTQIVREPLGVIAIISPFNFPVLLSLQSAFAALIAGNAVVHKPSEYAPLTALKIQELFRNAGLPRDLFQVVTGAGETGWELVHAGVDHISFVGSSKTGRKVAAAAGEQLIPATLELGGKNGMIVLNDAPLSRAVDGALTYAFVANGQTCTAINRIYVQKAIAAEFTSLLQERIAKWTVSTNVRANYGDITALINEESALHVEGQVNEAVAGGARILCGGKRLERCDAAVYLPTILVDVTAEMRVVREETFGPVLSVMEIADVEEAIKQVNNSPYGLTASVWTRDNDLAWMIARKLKVATVAVNDHMWPFFAPEVPWGGIKASGLGRVGGAEGLQSMTYQKVISFDRFNLPRELYWYPRPKWLYFALLLLVPILYSRKPEKRARALIELITGLQKQRKSATHDRAENSH
ncbi:MAG: aldehyde dehydrogenase family protein [Anaerolineaceae bacterium]|nr:MAG: aldehyde dehydrogenase family protein [Anaerolineaceae bacterium]